MMFARVSSLLFVALCVASSGCNGDSFANSDCGNGELESGEFCDDGNTNDGDGCAHDCLIERDQGEDGPDAGGSEEGEPDAGQASVAIVINEYAFGHLGTDVNEFIEVMAGPNQDLSNLTLLVIEGDATTAGPIDFVHKLGTTNAQGL